MINLQYLKATVEEESISTVAKRLGISVSTLFHALKGAEIPRSALDAIAAEFPAKGQVVIRDRMGDVSLGIAAAKEKALQKKRAQISRNKYYNKVVATTKRILGDASAKKAANVRKKIADQLVYKKDFAKHRQEILRDAGIVSALDFARLAHAVCELPPTVTVTTASAQKFIDGHQIPGVEGHRLKRGFLALEDHVLFGKGGRPDWAPSIPSDTKKPHPWKLTAKERAADLRKRKQERDLGLAKPLQTNKKKATE